MNVNSQKACIGSFLILLLLQSCGGSPYSGSWIIQLTGDLTNKSGTDSFEIDDDGKFSFTLTLCSDDCKQEYKDTKIKGNVSDDAIINAGLSDQSGLDGALVGQCSIYICGGQYEATIHDKVLRGPMNACNQRMLK